MNLFKILIGLCITFILTSCSKTEDRELMWETRKYSDGKIASTHEAQEAAERYFKRTDLIGRNKEEVFELVGHPQKSNDSVYNFPFYPPEEENVIVYRFDTGNYGWQFNIILDDNDTVTKVVKLGIE
ncbi:MAG: hypothetical protein HUJ26_20440 [Planctomycetaceae bacterium]|nr:hypothetical protein [Planctomycetaceae bacterium]